MAENYEFFYQGTPYSLEPNYGDTFTGYRMSAGELGATTSIQTANQVKEVSNLLNQGIKNVEVSMIKPDVFEMISDQQLKEINRLSKLTGAETTLHSPLIDPSGFTEQGWSESNRELAERNFTEIVKRGHQLNPKGNIPVTIHSSYLIPGTEDTPAEKGKETQRLIALNQETKELIALNEMRQYSPEEGEIKINPIKRLDIQNNTQWKNSLANINFYKKEADEMLDSAALALGPEKVEKILNGEKIELNSPQEQKARNQIQHASAMLDHVSSQFRNLYDQSRRFIDLNKLNQNDKARIIKVFNKIRNEWTKLKSADAFTYSNLLDNSISLISSIDIAPEIYKPIEDFAVEKASQTFGNVAFNSYKKFGNTSPIISIENPPYGSALSRAEDLKNLVKESRKKFVERAQKEGYSKSEAEEAAKKIIGVTWDTSHINMMRKQGFKEKDVLEESTHPLK